MKSPPRIAIIGGSKEAVDLARALQGADVCLFETPYYPSPKGIKTQVYDANTDWAQALQGFNALVFAPHPFAFDVFERIRDTSLPHVALLRPPWQPGEGDDWTLLESGTAAAQYLQSCGAKRALLAIGRERLVPFLQTSGPDLRIRCRNLPEPDVGRRGTVEYMTGPFSVEQERRYLQDNAIDCIVVHNAGGFGGWPKLQAARELQIPVIMIDRPPVDWPAIVETPQQAIAWLRQSAGLDLRGRNP